MLTFILIALGVVALIAASGVRILREYERAVVFRLGRVRTRLGGPGLLLLLPMGIDRARVVNTRTRVEQIAPQEVITRDNISIGVDAVVYVTIQSPSHAILEVEEYMPATLQLAATTLRTVIGRMDLDDILAHRDEINSEVRNILDLRTEQWGVEISAVELKDIVLPQEMKRAMARQAEAERERRAKVIAAEGERQAAAQLAEAAGIIDTHPGALQLRLYQTMLEMSSDPSAKIVVPIPIELLAGIKHGASISVDQLTKLVEAAVEASRDRIEGEEGKSQPLPDSSPANLPAGAPRALGAGEARKPDADE